MLEKIEEFAYKTLSIEEIALLLDYDVNKFKVLMTDQKSPEAIAYKKGRARIKHDLMTNIVELAKKGSPQAAQIVISKLSKE